MAKRNKLTLEQIAAADQGEAEALKMLDASIETYIRARSMGTRTEALVAINNGLVLSVRNGAATNVVAMLTAAIVKLGEQTMDNRGMLRAD